MGTCKALLPYRGMLLIDHMKHLASEAMSAAFPGEAPAVLVSGPPSLRLPGYTFVPDEVPGNGPLGGVLSLLRYCDRLGFSNHGYLILPIDMPLLTVELLVQLLKSSDGADVCQFRGWQLPVLLRDRPWVRCAIEEIFDLRGSERFRSFRALYSRLTVNEIPLNQLSERFFLNANTPSEWRVVSTI